VTDWLAAGGTKDDLYDLVIATPAWVMTPGTSTPEHQAEPEQQDEAAADPRSLVAITEQRIRRLERESAWQRKLRANHNLSAPTKATRALVVERYQRVRAHDDGFMRVHLPTLAQELGVSASSVSDHPKTLEAAGALLRRIETTLDANCMPRQDLAIKLTDALLFYPETIAPPVAKNGGCGWRARVRASCGSADLVVRTQIVCRSCGSVEQQIERPPQDEPATTVACEGTEQQAANTPSAQDSCSRSQDDWMVGTEGRCSVEAR
jgi:hypothetical protein